MKFSLASLALLLSMGTAAYATDVPPIVAPYPNHVTLGEADDTLTSPSMLVREALPLPAPADRTLFKEIVPCRLPDTRKDASTVIGTMSHAYPFVGLPVTNDCHGVIDATIPVVALTIQVTSYNSGTTIGYLTWGYGATFVPLLHSVAQGADGFLLYEDQKTVVQAGTVTVNGPVIRLWNATGTTDVTVDILGYHIADTTD